MAMSISPPIQAQSAGVQPTSPGCGKPSCVQLDRRQVADQEAVGVERALGRAGGARGVDQHRRILGPVAAGAIRPRRAAISSQKARMRRRDVAPVTKTSRKSGRSPRRSRRASARFSASVTTAVAPLSASR